MTKLALATAPLSGVRLKRLTTKADTQDRLEAFLRGFLIIALMGCFFPYYFSTPVGFLSIVDMVVLVWCPLAILISSRREIEISYRLGTALLSFFALVLVVAAQVNAGISDSVGPMVKYGVFLFATPLALHASRFGPDTLEGPRRPSRLVAIAGVTLAIATLYKIATHSVQGGGDSYYVIMLGGLLNKNWLGALLSFGVVACMVEWVHGKGKIYLAMAIIHIATITIIGARASTIGAVLASLLIYLFLNPKGLEGISKRIASLFVVVLLLGVLLASGLLNGQLARMQQLSETNTQQVNASNSRLLLWAFAVDKIRQHPFLGWGFGTFKYEGVGWLNGMYEPHDNILQITYACGFCGLLCLIAVIIFSLRPNIGMQTSFIRISACTYMAETLVDIIWTRGDGHLFWLLLFINTFSIGGASKARVGGEVRSGSMLGAPNSMPAAKA